MVLFDKTRLTPCPVLTPTETEFASPIEYLSRPDVAAIGSKYGLVKVVPPAGWRPPFSISPDFQFHTRHQKLSDLGITTRSRKFFTNNINRFLKMTGKKQLRLQFKVKSDHDARPIKIYHYDLYCAVENSGGVDSLDDAKWAQINTRFGLPPTSSALSDQYELYIKGYAQFLSHNDNKNYQFPDSDSEDEMAKCLVCGKNNSPTTTLLCDNCDNPFHMKCLSPPLTTIPRGSWFCDRCLIGTGEYGFEEPTEVKYTLPQFYNMCAEFESWFKNEFNITQPLNIDIIEQKFWEFVDVEKSDLEVKYGADIHNLRPGQISGFPMPNTPQLEQMVAKDASVRDYVTHPCNLTKLPFAKGSLLNFINTSISGMTVPWIYIGSLLSTFCWHVEDHYTLSANYCHMGATKKWYGIPSQYAEQFENLMRKSAPDLFQRQPDLLHQLVTLMSPMTLVQNGIPVMYADQQPNEFVVTYPRVYHAGFNSGFNFNEAVNFAMPQWLEFGEQSIHDYRSIKKENVFDHYQLVENILREFTSSGDSLSVIDVGNDETSRIDLIRRCLSSFETFYTRQVSLLKRFNKLQENFAIKYQPRVFEKRKFEDEQIGHFTSDNRRQQENGEHSGKDDDEKEDDLCDVCRTHISYQYCVIDNKRHRFASIVTAGSATNEQQPAQLITPDIKQEALFAPPPASSLLKPPHPKIPISQLLTPESSPYEQVKHHVSDDEKYTNKLAQLSNLASAEQLSLLSTHEQRVSPGAAHESQVDPNETEQANSNGIAQVSQDGAKQVNQSEAKSELQVSPDTTTQVKQDKAVEVKQDEAIHESQANQFEAAHRSQIPYGTEHANPNVPEVRQSVPEVKQDVPKVNQGGSEQVSQNASNEADEWDRLIAEAKQTASQEPEHRGERERDAESRRKRRRSTRIQRSEAGPRPKSEAPRKHSASQKHVGKMTAVQNTCNLKVLNQQAEIRLCLQCCLESCGEFAERAPGNSTLVYEVYPQAMQDLIDECKALMR